MSGITVPCMRNSLIEKDPEEQVKLIYRLKFHGGRLPRTLREELNGNLRAEPRGIKRREMPEEEKKATR